MVTRQSDGKKRGVHFVSVFLLMAVSWHIKNSLDNGTVT